MVGLELFIPLPKPSVHGGYASPHSAKLFFLKQLSVSCFFFFLIVLSESKFLYIQNTVSVVP